MIQKESIKNRQTKWDTPKNSFRCWHFKMSTGACLPRKILKLKPKKNAMSCVPSHIMYLLQALVENCNFWQNRGPAACHHQPLPQSPPYTSMPTNFSPLLTFQYRYHTLNFRQLLVCYPASRYFTVSFWYTAGDAARVLKSSTCPQCFTLSPSVLAR